MVRWKGPDFGDQEFDDDDAPTERRWVGGSEVVVHYANLPNKDRTTIKGIPVTTPLRTVIDLATTVDPDHLRRMVVDCLQRRLFTVEEAMERLDEPDMVRRRGAALVRRVLAER